jgi:hypothetical protein
LVLSEANIDNETFPAQSNAAEARSKTVVAYSKIKGRGVAACWRVDVEEDGDFTYLPPWASTPLSSRAPFDIK